MTSWGDPLLRADDAHLDVILVKLREVAANEAAQKPHEEGNLEWRAFPVLRRKAEEGEIGNAQVHGGAHAFPRAFDPAPVAFRPRQAPLRRPAAVAVHNDRDMFWKRALIPERKGLFLQSHSWPPIIPTQSSRVL